MIYTGRTDKFLRRVTMGKFAISNFSYLEDVLGFKPSSNPRRFQECLRVMESYTRRGDQWWIEFRGNPVELAVRQLAEPVLLIPISTFEKGLRTVLERPVDPCEISHKNNALFVEFSEKYKAYRAANRQK
jgi:hypothetical protein